MVHTFQTAWFHQPTATDSQSPVNYLWMKYSYIHTEKALLSGNMGNHLFPTGQATASKHRNKNLYELSQTASVLDSLVRNYIVIVNNNCRYHSAAVALRMLCGANKEWEALSMDSFQLPSENSKIRKFFCPSFLCNYVFKLNLH